MRSPASKEQALYALDSGHSVAAIFALMELPNRAPGWAQPLVGALIDAGFKAGEELRGGMAGYSLALRRDDCEVHLGGDRGDFDVNLAFPNPRKGRGHPRTETMPAEDYVAGVRGDADASFLLQDPAGRHSEVARWLAERVATLTPLALDEALLDRISALQRQRAKALFG
jgi:hypothetical protein